MFRSRLAPRSRSAIVWALSCDNVIQKAIWKMDVADDVTKRKLESWKLVSELEGSVMKCAMDIHGSHVIQKAINVADDVTKGKLISELEGSIMKCARLQIFMDLATDVHGFYVIQKAIDLADDVTKGKLMSELVGSVAVGGKDE